MAIGISGTISTSATELAGVLKELWIAVAENDLMIPDGLFRALPVDPFAERSGTTVNITRYAELPDQTSTITDEISAPALRALVTGKVTADIVTLADNVGVSELGQLTSLDGAERVPKLIANQAKRSVERYLADNITKYARLIRADLDANYQVQGTLTTVTSTTVVKDTALIGTGDDYWNGGLFTIFDPENNVLESRFVSDFTSADGTVTLGTALSYAPAVGTKYALTEYTGITDAAADHLNLDNLREAQVLLHATGHYGPAYEDNGGYPIVLDAYNFGDMTADSDVISLFINKEKESGLRNYGWNGNLLSLNPVQTMRPFRCAVSGAGTYAANGVCDIALVMSNKFASRMPLEKNDIEIIIKGKDEGGHYNALNLYGTAGWKHKLAAALHDTSAAVGIACGQTGLITP